MGPTQGVTPMAILQSTNTWKARAKKCTPGVETSPSRYGKRRGKTRNAHPILERTPPWRNSNTFTRGQDAMVLRDRFGSSNLESIQT